MTQQEKKKYILEQWKPSSGKRITEMLKRYWLKEQDIKQDQLISAAKEIFNEKTHLG